MKDETKKAKKSLKYIITFLEILITHLEDKNELMASRALLTSFVIDKYFDEGLSSDLKKMMMKYGESDNEVLKKE